MNDDKLMQAARQLSTKISPERDLWPGIAEAIEKPAPRRWSPMFAQAAAVVLLVGASSAVTYMSMKNSVSPIVIASPDMVFEQASFGNRYNLGPGFQAARNTLVADLDVELERLSPEARENIEVNLTLIHSAINNMNVALEEDPENIVLQERLLRTYREELALLRRVRGLTRNVMLRNDI
ncbi:MAG: hypothetical protein GWP67_11720 [Gammaproteobacteria bacterium]|jgi:hypothetical protein|nr:hypothetical protein [Gammaproteobacteria bacterium]